jgi:hypothetical protein
MNNLSRIQSISRAFQWFLVCWCICTPILYGGYWILYNSLPHSIISHNFPIPLPQELSLKLRCAALASSFLPVSVQMMGLWLLIRLFRLYANGSIFTPEHVTYFRRLGYVLLVWTFSGILNHSFLTMIFSLATSPHSLTVSLGLSSTDLTALVVGGIVVMISWIMEEGRKLQDEQTLFI